MRKPITQGGINRSQNQLSSTMAVKGINTEDLPQLLDLKFAQVIKNYLIEGQGKLEKRKGFSVFKDFSVSAAPTFVAKYTNDVYLIGHGNTIKAYRISTDTITTIKSDFVNTRYEGLKYADYFFVVNGNNGTDLTRISQILNYDAQTANFTVGSVVTGGTSGATATILEDSDSGVTGYLTLGNISGTFEDNETITDAAGGSATANGVNTFLATVVTAAPKAEVIFQFDGRLILGNTDTDTNEIHISEKDDGTNPMFTNWTVPATVLPTSPNKIYNRNLGAVKDINTLAESIIVFYEDGAYSFSFGQIAAGSTIVQTNPTTFQSKDFGGERASVTTEAGIFYANERGIWRLYGVASTLKGNSKSEMRISRILGDDYFDDVDLTNLDIAYDQKRNAVLFTLGKDSTVNNQVLVYNINAEAWSTISGWNINRFMVDGATVYGIDINTVKIYKLFDGQSDNGNPINTEYTQEINLGSLTTRKSLENFFIQAEMSPLASLVVHFDRYNRRGVYETDVIPARTLENNLTTVSASGVGSSSYGSHGWGSLGGASNDPNTLGQWRARINDLYRLVIRITSNDDSSHILNWFSVLTKDKNINLRLNNLT